MPDSPTLSVCLITHNSGKTIEACLGSVADHVNEIILVDTCSTDDTRKKAAKFGVRIFDFDYHTHPQCFLQDTEELCRKFELSCNPTNEFFLADYAAARNHGFDRAKSDYILWFDTDDVMIGAENLPKVLALMKSDNLTHITANYDYTFDSLGNPTSHFPRARIVKNGSALRWIGTAHEILKCHGVAGHTDLINFQHKHWADAETTRTISHKAYKILRGQYDSLTNKLSNPRLLFYLGQESRSFDINKSISYYREYLRVSTFDQERAWARTILGRACEKTGDYNKAFEYYAAISADVTNNPDGHFGMARVAYHQKNWAKCISYSEAGFKISQPAPNLYSSDRKGEPHIFYNVALGNIERIQEALESCDKGLATLPGNDFLLQNKRYYEEKLRTPMPPPKSCHKVAPDGALDIVMWTGPSCSPWTMDDISNEKLGGSEAAALIMSKELVKLGHEVTLYAECSSMDQMIDGVQVVHHETLHAKPNTDCDVFISSRQPCALDFPITSRLKFFWAHDYSYGNDTQELRSQLNKANKILLLSEWARKYWLQCYPGFDQDKLCVTRNGIDVVKFAKEPVKIGKKMIYTSSPVRGLDILLRLMPRLRSEIPDLTLDVFFGFEFWEKMTRANGRTQELDLIRDLKDELDHTPGVVFRRRVPAKDLYAAFAEASVWAYPTAYFETFCTSALEAQAWACWPVTSDLGALSTTVRYGSKITPPNTSSQYQDAFVAEIKKVFDGKYADEAAKGRIWTLANCGWDWVAREWETMFQNMLRQQGDR